MIKLLPVRNLEKIEKEERDFNNSWTEQREPTRIKIAATINLSLITFPESYRASWFNSLKTKKLQRHRSRKSEQDHFIFTFHIESSTLS